MKHGILILAHQHFDHLVDLIKSFDDDFFIFIHLDKKNSFTDANLSTLRSLRQVRLVSKRFRVRWGGFNHLNSILFLAKEALKYEELGYFHVISGQDYPIKRIEYIKEIFEKNPANYMDYFEVRNSKWEQEWISRLSYYGFYEIFDSKTFWGKKINNGIILLQKKLGFSRKLPDLKLYGGNGWWSLSRATVKYVIDTSEQNSDLLRRLRFTFCADEVYFQTVLLNSSRKESLANNNLRFIDWTQRNGNFPAILDENDFQELIGSDKIFARKFDFPVSSKLKKLLDQYLKKPQ